MITASTIGMRKPKTRARNANQAVLATALPNRGSPSTRAKFSAPTNVGVDTRFVSWTLMTIARRIGNHENTPKTMSSGKRKTRVLSPSRVSEGRRRRRLGGRSVGFVGSARELTLGRRLSSGRRRRGRRCRPPRTMRSALVEDALDLAVRGLQERVDVRVLVGQDR